MSFRRIRAVFRKEVLHIVRDPRSLGMALLIPILMLGLFGYALSLDVNHLPAIIFDQDNSPVSRDLIQAFQGSTYFDVRSVTGDYTAIEKGINSNKIVFGLVIPPDFTRLLEGGKEAPVQVLLDGSDSNTASIAMAYVTTVVNLYALERTAQRLDQRTGMHVKPLTEAQVRVWYNNDLKSRNFIVPGLIPVILMIIAELLTSLCIAREWENGTMEQLLSTPIRPTELLLGKLSAFFVLGAADTVMSLLAAVFLFNVPLKGSLAFLGLSSFIFLFGALSWGIFISAATKSQLIAYQVGLLSSFLPAFLLSGFIYAVDNMPTVIRFITNFIPAKYYVTIMKGIFLKGVGMEVMWLELLWLTVYAVIIFTLAVSKMKPKIA